MSTPARPTSKQAPAKDWRAGVRASRSRQLVVLLVTALLVVGGAWLVGGRTKSATTDLNGAQAVEVTGPADGPAPQVGAVPQDFTATTVTGRKISLSALKGHPVWLTFGASWCTACRSEAPDVQAAYEAGKAKGLRVVSVNMQEMPADVQAYAGRVGLTFDQVADPDTALASRYRVMGLPSHFFIGADGVLRATHVGALTRVGMDEQLAAIGG